MYSLTPDFPCWYLNSNNPAECFVCHVHHKQFVNHRINTKLILFVLCFFCFKSAEDPSENYVKLRDFVLGKLCQGLSSFAVDKLHLGFSADMVKEAQEKLKINKVLYEAAAHDYFFLCSINNFVSNMSENGGKSPALFCKTTNGKSCVAYLFEI